MARRSVFTRAFWQEFRHDLRHAQEHKEARKAVGTKLVGLLALVFSAGYYVAMLYSLHDPATDWVIGSVLVLIVVIVGAVRFSQQREAREQLLRDVADAPKEISLRLQRYAHTLTALNERALSELYLSKFALPDGFHVQTRRLKIDALRASGAWEIVPTRVREWMMRPDGGWSLSISLSLLSRAETLHTLLWALALVRELRPSDRLLEPLDFRGLAKVLESPAIGVLPTWELRIARNEASVFFSRCYAENVVRGSVAADSEDQNRAVEEWMEAIQERRQPEAFVGAKSVSELDEGALFSVGRAAALRMLTLTRVMELIDGEPAWEGLCDMIFEPLCEDDPAISIETGKSEAQ